MIALAQARHADAIDLLSRAVAAAPERAHFLNNLGEAYRELLRFGADVEVLEPAELRERVAETSRRVASIYSR